MTVWALFAAFDGSTRAGGAAVVMQSAEIELLEGRADLALLWDIRVAPAFRHRGVGRLPGLLGVELISVEDCLLVAELKVREA